MNEDRAIFINFSLISASVICFEIISTRISSVIFVQNYAFIILSLAILGLGSGGIYSYYKIKTASDDNNGSPKRLFKFIILVAASLIVFICLVILFSISNPFIYFFLQFLPFFFAGIVYAQLYKLYASQGFKLYASDLVGAALGSLLSIFVFSVFTAPNTVLFLSIILTASSLTFIRLKNKTKLIGAYSILLLCFVLLAVNGKKTILGVVPIGNFPEKDFYHVYPDINVEAKIIDSRWSVDGRSDLVEYSHQNVVRQLFVDGSAGSQMYSFNGNIANHDKVLNKLLLNFTTSVPFLFLNDEQKKSMLVIGPGGGKEVLVGLLSNVKKITGVEVNPDFVDIVKKHKDYNGGIYTDFPNINIIVAEGRHFVKQSAEKYSIILMALPSTEQLQNINNLASNENYLFTVEAIGDYLNLLSDDGCLIFTVHNRWELTRLIVTSIYAFNKIGIDENKALNHFVVLGADYAPTVVIKKNALTSDETASILNISNHLPQYIPRVTYLPYNWGKNDNSIENTLLETIHQNSISLKDYIQKDKYDISPVRDDSPYFYKIERGVPDNYWKLLSAIAFIGLLFSFVPVVRIKNTKKNKDEKKTVVFVLGVFISIGIGFMILEVSLFQKFILYLGSPTISLSILLGSLLIGMGTGSFFGGKIFAGDLKKRLKIISLLIVAAGIILFIFSPYLLNELFGFSLVIRSVVSFFILLPFGFLLGIPFPSCLQLLKHNKLEQHIPWMYGINGIMSVLGSIAAVILSMLYGFTVAFFIGLCFYLLVFTMMISLPAVQKEKK